MVNNTNKQATDTNEIPSTTSETLHENVTQNYCISRRYGLVPRLNQHKFQDKEYQLFNLLVLFKYQNLNF